VLRLKSEYRYQMLIKSSSRKTLNEVVRAARRLALERRWAATALVVDVDPFTLM
jgi:primosomal protein N' (replication factor Y)